MPTNLSYVAPLLTDQGSVVTHTLGGATNSLEAVHGFRLVGPDTASALESADGQDVGTSTNSLSSE